MRRKIAVGIMCCMSILIVGILAASEPKKSKVITSINMPSTFSCKNENPNTVLASTSNLQSGLNSKTCPSLDTASILSKLEKRVNIKLIRSSELTDVHTYLLQQIQNLPSSVASTPNTIYIFSIHDPSKKAGISVRELFVLFKSYSSVPCWIFSDITLIIDSTQSLLGDYMQKYNLYMNIKTLVLNSTSVGLIPTLLCEKRISKHIESLQISKGFKNPSDNLDFVLPQMKHLKTLVIQQIFSDLLVKLFINSYRTFMNLDNLIVESGLCVSGNCMHGFTVAFLTVVNKVQKEVFLRWGFLQYLLPYISTKKPNSDLNPKLQAQKLTLDLSAYLPHQDVKLPNSKYIYFQLYKSIKILFKQNVNRYVFISSVYSLKKQHIAAIKLQNIIGNAYAAVKSQRQNPNIRVEYMDYVTTISKTILLVNSNRPVTD
jgi:hypothetical protein